MADMSTPVKGAAFDLYFTLYKSDGTVIANPGTYTKKISKDGGTIADCANSVTEVDTTYGLCKLTISTTEMNADAVWVQIKDNTTGCVPLTVTLYPCAALQTGDAYARLGAPAGASIAADLATIDANVDAVLADTGTDGVVVASGSKTGYALTSAYDAAKTAATQTSVDTVADYVDTEVAAVLAAVDTEVAAIKAKTDNLPASPAAVGSAMTLAADAVDAAAIKADAVTEIQSGLATAAALATVDGIVDDILADTAVIGAAGAGLSAVPWNAAWDAEVQSECADALTAYDAATGSDVPSAATTASAVRTELATELGRVDAAVSTRLATAGYTAPLDAAGTRTALGLASANLDTQLTGLPTDADVQTAAAAALIAYDPPTKAEMDAGLAGVTAPTAEEVADAVLDESLAGHTTAGTVGKTLNDLTAGADPWTADLPGDYEPGTAGYAFGRIQQTCETIGSLAITVQSPVAESGEITVYQGDDYSAADARSVTATVPTADVPDLAGATIKLKCLEATWTATACSVVGDNWSMVFEPDSPDTAVLTTRQQDYEVEATLANTHRITLAVGTLTTVPDIPEVAS